MARNCFFYCEIFLTYCVNLVDFRRVQAQGIQVFRLVYLSEEEFEFIKLKRVDFLKRAEG